MKINTFGYMDLIIISLLLILALIATLLILWSIRCPKGGFHDYVVTYQKYVKGPQIGWGIKASYIESKSTCKKCGHTYESIN